MKFSVDVPYTASVTVVVEAESVEEAKDKAATEAFATLCHHCSRKVTMGDPDLDHFTDDCVTALD